MSLSIWDKIRHPLVYSVRSIRRLRNLITIAALRAKGCSIDWTAHIHPTAVFERSGGLISIGAKTQIDRGVVIRAMGGQIHIGSNSNVNAYSILSGGGNLYIYDNVMIASHVSIYASNHIYSSLNSPMNEQGLNQKGISIESDVWVGTGVSILDGVCIKSGSVLAAGSVVNRSTLPRSINGGVPSKIIGSRDLSTHKNCNQKLKQ